MKFKTNELPRGARFYNKHTGSFYRILEGNVCLWNKVKWMKVSIYKPHELMTEPFEEIEDAKLSEK